MLNNSNAADTLCQQLLDQSENGYTTYVTNHEDLVT